MCGIGGILGERASESAVLRMMDALRHRGPDDRGVSRLASEAGEHAGVLGHLRLAILDPSPGGHQPMIGANGRLTITFNGEIYNFAELKRELARDGGLFRSSSDTEVILEGVRQHGLKFISRLRGMFAFAMWDRSRACCYLVRDQFGIKPLYYTARGGKVLFASEVRALLATGEIERRLDAEAVASYLSQGSVAEPLTMIKGVRAVPAGCMVEVQIQQGKAELSEPIHWAEPLAVVASRESNRARAIERVRAALEDSVANHLVSDVPVAFFLSGGVDSSAVAAIASRVARAQVETFTVTFSESSFSEAVHARAVAERFGTQHHEIHLTDLDLLKSLPAAFESMDQPSMDGINTFVVSRSVAAHGLKVVLSGLGGDELFGGYPSFGRARAAEVLSLVPRDLRAALAGAVSRYGAIRGEKLALLLTEQPPAWAAYTASRTLFPERTVAALCGTLPPASGASHLSSSDAREQVAQYELEGYMRSTLLRDTDVFSMAHGLEVRVPFVDSRLTSTLTEIDPSVRWAGRRPKALLIDAVRDLLPRQVWDRKKQGFTLPWELWLRGQLRDVVSETLTTDRIKRAGISPELSSQIWSAFVDRRSEVGWSRPWALYTLARWADENDVSSDPHSEMELLAATA